VVLGCSGCWERGNERLASLAEGLGVRERVHFLGYRSDPERFYQAADIFVLPTAYETFCRSAHEAAACGLPVVAPPVNGVRELVGANEAGIIAGRNPEEVARALVKLATDPELRLKMGRIGARRAAAVQPGCCGGAHPLVARLFAGARRKELTLTHQRQGLRAAYAGLTPAGGVLADSAVSTPTAGRRRLVDLGERSRRGLAVRLTRDPGSVEARRDGFPRMRADHHPSPLAKLAHLGSGARGSHPSAGMSHRRALPRQRNGDRSIFVPSRPTPVLATATLKREKPPFPAPFPEWAQLDLNQRPPACEAGALPLSYAPWSGEDTKPSAATIGSPVALGGELAVP
jgi:hypothetical protein